MTGKNNVMLLMCGLLIAMAGTANATWLGEGEYTDTSSTTALYHLNQDSGTVVVDDNSSGRTAHNGVLEGSTLPTWTTDGKFGNGLNFVRRTDSRLNMGDIITTDDFTLEFYVKWDGNGTDYFFNCYAETFARIGSSGQVDFGIHVNHAWKEIRNASADNLSKNTWYHLAFVRDYDPDSNTTSSYFYINGELAASGTFSGKYDATSSVMRIADSTDSQGNHYGIGGTIDEIRYTGAALDTFGVPEPATMMMITLGVGFIARHRR